MKTKTSKKNLWFKSLALLPLLSFMVYGFSSKEIPAKHVEPLIDIGSAEKHTARSIDIKILEDGNYAVDGTKTSKNTLAATVNTLHQDITPEVRNNIMNIHVTSTKEISNTDVWFIYNALLDYGFYRLVAGDQEVVRGKGNTPFKMAGADTEDDTESSTQKSATREQMAEYNKLAKHYNVALKEDKGVHIKMKHVERLKYIYSIMSAKQRKDAEPFPDFPKPPPPPPAPEVAGMIEKEVPMIPPPPPVPENATPAQKAKYKAVIAEYAKKHPKSVTRVKNADGELIEVVEVPTSVLEVPPPPPPPPPNPVQHMKELLNKGATFYFDGKKISGKEAIKIAEDNKDINIQVNDHTSSPPTVKLSTKPIRLKKKN